MQAVAYRGATKIAQSAIFNLAVVSPSGWSSQTGYKYPVAGSVRRQIVVNAAAAVGTRSGRSIFSNCTGCSYATDVSEGDGARIQKAIATKVGWKTADTKARDAQMRFDLGNPRYSATTINLIVARINSQVSATVANAGQGVLDSLGIQAQCAEWVQRLAFSSGAVDPAGSLVSDRSTAAPGFSLRSSNGNGHTALVADVKYDSSALPTDYALIDANYGTRWTNPAGDVAWDRMIRRASIAERGGILSYVFRSHSSETVLVGTPN